jgi:hypothetical protein
MSALLDSQHSIGVDEQSHRLVLLPEHKVLVKENPYDVPTSDLVDLEDQPPESAGSTLVMFDRKQFRIEDLLEKMQHAQPVALDAGRVAELITKLDEQWQDSQAGNPITSIFLSSCDHIALGALLLLQLQTRAKIDFTDSKVRPGEGFDLIVV